MKVILIKLVGVQMLEELQIKQMIDHRQELGKRGHESSFIEMEKNILEIKIKIITLKIVDNLMNVSYKNCFTQDG